jgi:hypothetical protein
VTLVKQFTNPTRTLLASSQGDLLNLGDGNWLMGYGGLPDFTEYNAAGQVIFDATLGRDVQDFRTYLAPWSATPRTKPQIAAQTTPSGTVTVEASWNGATNVASWRVLGGASQGAGATLATAPAAGFQTTITVATSDPQIAVEALGASGAVLATSPTITPSS